VPSKRLYDLKANVTSTDPNVLCLSDAKIDMANIRPIGNENAKVEIRDEPMPGLSRYYMAET